MVSLDQYVRVRDVATEIGMSTRSLTNRLVADGRELYFDPRDRRQRLARREDVDQLTKLVPVSRARHHAEAQIAG